MTRNQTWWPVSKAGRPMKILVRATLSILAGIAAAVAPILLISVFPSLQRSAVATTLFTILSLPGLGLAYAADHQGHPGLGYLLGTLIGNFFFYFVVVWILIGAIRRRSRGNKSEFVSRAQQC